MKRILFSITLLTLLLGVGAQDHVSRTFATFNTIEPVIILMGDTIHDICTMSFDRGSDTTSIGTGLFSVTPVNISGDFRDFGFSRSDTTITFNSKEAATDEDNPLYHADFRDGFDVSFTVRFHTLLTEQKVICKEANAEKRQDAFSVGYDAASGKVFAEVLSGDEKPHRINAGPTVTDKDLYDVRVRGIADGTLSLLELIVTPHEEPGDSMLTMNREYALYKGDALQYIPGRWTVGRDYHEEIPGTRPLCGVEVGNLRISGVGRKPFKK